MAVSFGIKSWIEGGVVAAVIALNIVVGFFQEFQAEKTMDSLRSLIEAYNTKVCRCCHPYSKISANFQRSPNLFSTGNITFRLFLGLFSRQ